VKQRIAAEPEVLEWRPRQVWGDKGAIADLIDRDDVLGT
jgi:hypothetical protein